MKNPSQDVLRGTLDMLVLRTLAVEAMHGWGISERIQMLSSDVLRINQGALYPAVHRLEKRALIRSYWGRSDNNRRAKFYELTKEGRGHLKAETARWNEYSGAVTAILAGSR